MQGQQRKCFFTKIIENFMCCRHSITKGVNI
jgi:hypothetical protein